MAKRAMSSSAPPLVVNARGPNAPTHKERMKLGRVAIDPNELMPQIPGVGEVVPSMIRDKERRDDIYDRRRQQGRESRQAIRFTDAEGKDNTMTTASD